MQQIEIKDNSEEKKK